MNIPPIAPPSPPCGQFLSEQACRTPCANGLPVVIRVFVRS
jgi:hypothetical protein